MIYYEYPNYKTYLEHNHTNWVAEMFREFACVATLIKVRRLENKLFFAAQKEADND